MSDKEWGVPGQSGQPGPYGAGQPADPYGAPPPPADPYGTPPPADPYGTPPPAAPFGAPQPPAYGAPPPAEAFGAPPAPDPQWGAYPQPGGYPQGAYGAAPYGYAPPAPPTPVSSILLTVFSVLMTVSCYFTLAGIAPMIFGILALTRSRTDPESARKLTKNGWIAFGVGAGINLLAWIGFMVWVFVMAANAPDTYSSYSSYSY